MRHPTVTMNDVDDVVCWEAMAMAMMVDAVISMMESSVVLVECVVGKMLFPSRKEIESVRLGKCHKQCSVSYLV